jgi:hypothetical protein
VASLDDRWEYTIPHNTSEAGAIKVECPISPGLLTDLFIYFPGGCKNLARCRVFIGEKPIAPRSAKHYIAADAQLIPLRMINELISDNLPVLNWWVWNLDDTYDHTIWMLALWQGMDEPVDLMTYRELKDLVDLWKKLIGVT